MICVDQIMPKDEMYRSVSHVRYIYKPFQEQIIIMVLHIGNCSLSPDQESIVLSLSAVCAVMSCMYTN